MNTIWLLILIYPWPADIRTPGENEGAVWHVRTHATEEACLDDLKNRRAKAGPPTSWRESFVCMPVRDKKT